MIIVIDHFVAGLAETQSEADHDEMENSTHNATERLFSELLALPLNSTLNSTELIF